MGAIRVNYANARAQARKLQKVSSDCDDIVQNLRKALQEVAACWEGQAADAFCLLLQQRINEVQSIGNTAEQLARQIRRVADEFEAAERRIKSESNANFGGGGGGGRF